MVVKSKKTSQKGGVKRGREESRSPEPTQAALDREKKKAKVEEDRSVLAVSAELVPPTTYMENLADMVEGVLVGETPEARSASVRAFSESVIPGRSPSPGLGSQPPEDVFSQVVLRDVVPLEEPIDRFAQITRVIADAAVHNAELFLAGSRMLGQVIRGTGIVVGEAVGSVLGFLAINSKKYGEMALEYLKTNGKRLLEAGKAEMARVYASISAAAGRPMPELVAVLRLEGGALPGVAMTLRLANAVGPSLGAGFAEYIGAAASWCWDYLYSFGYYLLTAPSYVDVHSLLPVLGEVINYSLGVISGGMITAVPFGTVVQATILIMTGLAVYDYLTPEATGVIEKGKQLLNKLLQGLSRLGGKIGELARRLMERIRTLSGHQYFIYVLELYERATYMAGVPGFYSIAVLIKLVQFLAPRVRETPAFAGRLLHIIRLLQSKGAGGQVPPELAAGAQTAIVQAQTAIAQLSAEEKAAAEAELATAEAELATAVAAAAEDMDNDGAGGGTKSQGGQGRIRKSRKSSSKKGKKGGAKVKTAKLSEPCKKSKGKKTKKSKKN